jgi:hypothetical protein
MKVTPPLQRRLRQSLSWPRNIRVYLPPQSYRLSDRQHDRLDRKDVRRRDRCHIESWHDDSYISKSTSSKVLTRPTFRRPLSVARPIGKQKDLQSYSSWTSSRALSVWKSKSRCEQTCLSDSRSHGSRPNSRRQKTSNCAGSSSRRTALWSGGSSLTVIHLLMYVYLFLLEVTHSCTKDSSVQLKISDRTTLRFVTLEGVEAIDMTTS